MSRYPGYGNSLPAMQPTQRYGLIAETRPYGVTYPPSASTLPTSLGGISIARGMESRAPRETTTQTLLHDRNMREWQRSSGGGWGGWTQDQAPGVGARWEERVSRGGPNSESSWQAGPSHVGGWGGWSLHKERGGFGVGGSGGGGRSGYGGGGGDGQRGMGAFGGGSSSGSGGGSYYGGGVGPSSAHAAGGFLSSYGRR